MMKKKNRLQASTTDINTGTDNTAREGRRHPIWNTTQNAWIGIGNALQYDQQWKIKNRLKLGLDSEKDSEEIDLSIPPAKDSRSYGMYLHYQFIYTVANHCDRLK